MPGLISLGRLKQQQNLVERSFTEAALTKRPRIQAEERSSAEILCLDRKEEPKKGLRIDQNIFLNTPISFILDSSYFSHSSSGEKNVERNIYLFVIERIELKKRMSAVHVRDQKHEQTPPRNRANPQGPIFEFDPEIERTQRNLKRRVRRLMEVNRNNGQQPADGRNQPAQAEGAIVPPIPQDNQQPPVRTVRDYLAEDLEGLNPAVTMPEFEAEHFELKPVMFNMLNTLGQFGGSPTENARQHLKSFLEICNSFKIHGVSNDVLKLKLKLFPYSLRDKAKAWLNNLQPGSLQSWTQLCQSFLAKFSYTTMTDHLRNQITYFRQEDDEAMHEAWEQYRDLFRRCLMHGLPEWTQVSIFYNSVNTPTRMMLDATANGTLLDKPPRESLEILDKLAQNDYQHPTSRRGNTRRGPTQLDSSDTILAHITSLTNMVKNM
ncbi:hypothetical protein V6N13_074272 [Hibiscus sabdariffa]|uniref:Retrotransposon gag domain-containing protein n=1 Tax=Hibiscus sabdariffa TaxID=183260 RepID=A0ABR2U882_9ROSI